MDKVHGADKKTDFMFWYILINGCYLTTMMAKTTVFYRAMSHVGQSNLYGTRQPTQGFCILWDPSLGRP
jgi:hypothetical protein